MKRGKIKIVNLKKFIRSILLILLFILLLSLFIVKGTLSHKEIQYKKYNVSYGDTLWSIALNEQRYNLFYKGTDVRDIISNLIEVNNLNNNNLINGQKLNIPIY